MQIPTSRPTAELANLLAGDESSLFGRLLRSGPGTDRRVAFLAWLRLGLEAQLTNLEEFLASLPREHQSAFESWLASRSYSDLVPKDAPTPDRLLFLLDLETILALREPC